jgi:hypothetical protein
MNSDEDGGIEPSYRGNTIASSWTMSGSFPRQPPCVEEVRWCGALNENASPLPEFLITEMSSTSFRQIGSLCLTVTKLNGTPRINDELSHQRLRHHTAENIYKNDPWQACVSYQASTTMLRITGTSWMMSESFPLQLPRIEEVRRCKMLNEPNNTTPLPEL